MPRFVSEAAEEIRDNPTEGEVAEMVVQVDSERQPAARDWIVAQGGEVTDSLPSGLMEVVIPERRVSALCDLEYVVSVEHSDEQIEVLSRGN